jgi:hypothetical protein
VGKAHEIQTVFRSPSISALAFAVGPAEAHNQAQAREQWCAIVSATPEILHVSHRAIFGYVVFWSGKAMIDCSYGCLIVMATRSYTLGQETWTQPIDILFVPGDGQHVAAVDAGWLHVVWSDIQIL